MGEKDIVLIVVVVVVIAIILNSQINKLSKKIDRDEISPNLTCYDKFCNLIDQKLSWIKTMIESGRVKDDKDQSSCLEIISELTKELVFIQTMNANLKDSAAWEQKLFNFLNKVDEFVVSNLKDGQNISQNLKSDLKEEFQKLKI